MKDQASLNLLIVEQDDQIASRLEQICREAGYAVNARKATQADELRSALGRQPWDLILTGSRVTGIDVSEVTAAVTERNCDAPVVVITPPGDETPIAEMFSAGARDVAGLEPADRLKHIIHREFLDLRDRRALRHYKHVLEEYEHRLLYFLGRAEKRQGQNPPGEQPPLQTDAADPAVSPVGKTTTADQIPRHVTAAPADTPVTVQDTDTSSQSSFLEALSGALESGSTHPGYQALLYLKLDKGPLAALGAEAVHAFLDGVEKRLRDSGTPPRLMSRFDDFAFVVLIGHSDRQGLVRTVYGIKHAIEGTVLQVGDREVTPACSIGVCLADQHMRRASGLIANARTACEKATGGGGKRICFSGTAVPKAPAKAPASASAAATPMPVSVHAARATAKDGWSARLASTLKEDRFRLVFQPVVNFHAAPIETYEILLRMIDEKGREVMPGEFIPKAEAGGLMEDIDRWVVKTAASALQQRRVSGFSTRLFVKLSAASIESEAFPAWLEEMLQIMQLPAESLVFQLSEPMLSQHMDRARVFTQWLTTMGCSAALDHFGLQKDSLQTAKTLPVKYLKIHGKLIQSLARDISSQRLLKEIVDTARASDMVTIASFVQDPYILSILWRCRVDYVQGFYFQPPKPAMAYDFTSAIS